MAYILMRSVPNLRSNFEGKGTVSADCFVFYTKNYRSFLDIGNVIEVKTNSDDRVQISVYLLGQVTASSEALSL
ncbi:hypothetical protein N7467_001932 [Penicillium canescens]|nr:hypothetical protein N7467_001932 [Penicillium canescens]